MKKFVLWLHRSLFGLYPLRFRHEFGEEILLTFGDVVDDAVQENALALLRVGFRELWDFPAAVLSAYWSVFQERDGRDIMFSLANEKNWKIGSQREARIAALPPLIFGLSFALGILIVHDSWQRVPMWRMWLGTGVMLTGAVVLAVGGLIALWKRIPDWGYSWVGFAYMGLVLFIKTWAEERADFGLPMVSPVIDQIIAIVALLGLAVFLGIAVLRGWQQAGLISLGYAGMLEISLFGMLTAAPAQRLDLALWVVPVSVMMALLVYWYCSASDSQRIVILFLAALLYGAVLWLIFIAWQEWYQMRGGMTPILALFVIFMILLIAGPVGGVLGTPLRRKLRKG